MSKKASDTTSGWPYFLVELSRNSVKLMLGPM